MAWNEPSETNSVFLAAPATHEQRIELKSDLAGLFPARFSDDGKYLATVTPEGAALRVWNVDIRQILDIVE